MASGDAAKQHGQERHAPWIARELLRRGAMDYPSSVRWIVGDVQGCAREFDDLLRAIHFDPAHDEIWLAGDIINRGPDSLATLRLWKSIGGHAVIGNHEIYALCTLRGRWPRKQDTLQDLFDAPDAEPLLRILGELPVLVHLPSDGLGPEAWLVHGGLDPRWRDVEAIARRINPLPHDDAWLLHDDVSFATRVRCCTADGLRSRHDERPETCPPPFRPWDEFYTGRPLVVHGHWARRGHYRGRHTLGLDSGCVYGGPLTAWCQDEDRIVQVPSRHR